MLVFSENVANVLNGWSQTSVFWCFQEVEKDGIRNEWVKLAKSEEAISSNFLTNFPTLGL